MPQRSLLLIDDDPGWLICFSDYFRQLNYKVLTAATCAEGIVLAQTCRPACILLDYHMPDFAGCEFSLGLERGAELKKIPIIMVSGDPSQEHSAHSDYQMDGFFLKDWPLDRAAGMVESLLRRVSLERGILTRGDLRLEAATLRVFRNSKPVTELLPEQFRLFSLLLEKSPSFVSEHEISRRVFRENGEGENKDRIRGLVQRLRVNLGLQLGRRIRSNVDSGWIYLPPRERD